MDVYLRLFCVCVGSGLATGLSPVQGDLPTVYRTKKLKRRPRPNKGLYTHNKNNVRNKIIPSTVLCSGHMLYIVT
jgi:hypothetical protein